MGKQGKTQELQGDGLVRIKKRRSTSHGCSLWYTGTGNVTCTLLIIRDGTQDKTAVYMFPHPNQLSSSPPSLQSGHQKGAERSEERDSWWRHIHAPWVAEGKPLL